MGGVLPDEDLRDVAEKCDSNDGLAALALDELTASTSITAKVKAGVKATYGYQMISCLIDLVDANSFPEAWTSLLQTPEAVRHPKTWLAAATKAFTRPNATLQAAMDEAFGEKNPAYTFGEGTTSAWLSLQDMRQPCLRMTPELTSHHVNCRTSSKGREDATPIGSGTSMDCSPSCIMTTAKRLPKVAKTQRSSAAVRLWTVLFVTGWLNAAAVFTPNSYAEIGEGWSSCKKESVTGVCPKFTLAEPLTGRGFGTNGVIDTWNVAKIKSLAHSKSYFRLYVSPACPSMTLT